MILKLVLLETGTKKDGAIWGRVTVKGTDANGTSHLANFWTTGDVITAAVKAGVKEDERCEITFGLDNFLRPVVTKVSPVAASRSAVSGVL